MYVLYRQVTIRHTITLLDTPYLVCICTNTLFRGDSHDALPSPLPSPSSPYFFRIGEVNRIPGTRVTGRLTQARTPRVPRSISQARTYQNPCAQSAKRVIGCWLGCWVGWKLLRHASRTLRNLFRLKIPCGLRYYRLHMF